MVCQKNRFRRVIRKIQPRAVLACACQLFLKYLCEKESFSKTILACLSGAQVGWIHAEKRQNKSRDTATFHYGDGGVAHYSYCARVSDG